MNAHDRALVRKGFRRTKNKPGVTESKVTCANGITYNYRSIAVKSKRNDGSVMERTVCVGRE